MRLTKIILTSIFIVAIMPVNAVVTVGFSIGQGTCDYNTIQAALDSGDIDIRIVNNQEYVENLTINQALNLRGGFSTCTQAAEIPPNPTSVNTVIKGTAVLGQAVITINSVSGGFIKLHNLTLKDAIDTIFINNGGHGINVINSGVDLELYDSVVSNNTGENGAGIYLGSHSGNLSLNLYDSKIIGNTATLQGGGIFCQDNLTFINVYGSSLIYENNAEDGAGVSIESGCRFYMDAGVDIFSSNQLRGIMHNHASRHGGGISAIGSSIIIDLRGNTYGFNNSLGNNIDPVTIAYNTAGLSAGSIYFENNNFGIVSSIKISDGLISNNNSAIYGGAFVIKANVELTMETSGKKCWNNNECSVLFNNTSGNRGGGLFLDRNAKATIQNTYISGNRSNSGAVAYVDEGLVAGANLTLDGNYIYKNGNNGVDFNDENVIYGKGDVDVSIIHNTITDNDIAPSFSIIESKDGSNFIIKNSIIHNSNETVFASSGAPVGSTDFSCILVNENSSISGLEVNVANPSFIDSNNENYHLADGSQAIDLCASASSLSDTDGDIRGWDDINMVDILGTYDAGADERKDMIFKDNFE